MKLIIAKPSPYARKVRIVLQERNIPYDEIIDVPWHPETVASEHNPLGKIPILLLDDGSIIYESSVIAEYLETLEREPKLIPADPALRVAVKQIEALADGVCDAIVLTVLEQSRSPGMQSADWLARQRAKIEGGVADFDRRLGNRTWLVADEYSLADIAIACTLAYLDLRLPGFNWREPYPRLVKFSERLEKRPAFQASRPEAQEIIPLR
jgi:glutathione S-transferase